MPTYEFTCSNCPDSELKVILPISGTIPEYQCFRCGEQMKRQYTSPAITFKGSGFYRTDK